MFINHDHRFIFIHIPKTGGTSITTTFKDWFKYVGVEREDPAPEVHHVGMDSIKGHADYFKFCFVRNPWDRFLSGYTEFITSRVGYHEPEAVKLKNQFPTFESFCKGFATSEFADNIHFKSQSSFVNESINFVGRYENLEDDFISCCNKIGLPISKLEKWDRKSNHVHYTKAYTKTTEDIVRNLFSDDIEMFNYSFHPTT